MTTQKRWIELSHDGLKEWVISIPGEEFWDRAFIWLAPGYLEHWNNRELIFPHLLIASTRERIAEGLSEHITWRTSHQLRDRLTSAIARIKSAWVNQNKIQLPPEVAEIFSDTSLRARLLTWPDITKIIITKRWWNDRPYVWTAWWKLTPNNKVLSN